MMIKYLKKIYRIYITTHTIKSLLLLNKNVINIILLYRRVYSTRTVETPISK